jgi:hypothetical protein
MLDSNRDYEHDKNLWTTEAGSDAPRGGGDLWSPRSSGGGLFGGGAAVQRLATPGGAAPTLASHELVPSGGQPLSPVVQRKMERALGADFSDVRVHQDDGRTRAMNAEAYTVGRDIVFGGGNYDPHSAEGQHTLAHELTHVVQQRSGPVAGSEVGDGVSVSDPSDSFERAAEDAADRAMGGSPVSAPVAAAPSGGGSSGGATVQRKPGPMDALEGPIDAAKNLYGILSKPAGSVERRDAAMDALKEGLGKIPFIGEKLGDMAQNWKNKEEAKLGTVTEGDGMEVKGEMNGDNATINRNLQGENVGDIDTGNGQIVKPDGTIVNKDTGEEVKDTQPAPEENKQAEDPAQE